MMDKRTTTRGHVAAFITIFIWGTTFISTKWLLESFSPVEILFFRTVLAYLVLLVLSPHFIKYRSLKEELLFVLAGICGASLFFVLQNTAISLTQASNVGVLISVAPFFTAMLSHLVTRDEDLSLSFFIGFIVSIIGIILIAFNGKFVLKLNPLGDILAILSAAVWAVYSVTMKKISSFGYNTLQTTRKVFFYGLLTLLPFLGLFDFRLGLERFAEIPNLLNMLFLGVGASALCFVTWNYALGILGAVKTSVYIYISPVVTIVTSAIFLSEKITPLSALGVILILSGLYLSERRTTTRESISGEPVS